MMEGDEKYVMRMKIWRKLIGFWYGEVMFSLIMLILIDVFLFFGYLIYVFAFFDRVNVYFIVNVYWYWCFY